MRILVINGPNINLLGLREPDIYGKETYDDLCSIIREEAELLNIEVRFYQSNHEGDLVDAIQESRFDCQGIIINPAAYTHTSIALLDALKAIQLPAIEVHLSAPLKREKFRHISYVGEYANDTIRGKGIEGYIEALKKLRNLLER